MRKNLPLASLFIGSVLASSVAVAQTDRFAYAVTDVTEQGYNWQYVRKLNFQTGEYGQVLLSGNDATAMNYDATSRKQMTTGLTDARLGNTINAAFGTGVAAMAYDSRNNRLYYTPMMFDQLRYVDLKTMKVYFLTDQEFSGKSVKSSDQGNIVTRMVIASDGNGYAMTNDATQLLRFSTGKKTEVTDLGSLVDDPANKGISIHNSCSSYGGDMIADDDGNLYVFSARNHVFKVNIESKVATHLGYISGLAEGFTVNGAAVTDKNQIIVASAVKGGSLYLVDAKSLVATPYNVTGSVWYSSDLANGNFLVSGNKPKETVAPDMFSRNIVTANTGDGKINIYPNPVTNNQFVIQFNQLEAGTYTIQVTDVTGRQVIQQQVNLSGDGQSQTVKLGATASKGIYMVNVSDQASKSVFTSKLVVQ